eukprot:g7214.t1
MSDPVAAAMDAARVSAADASRVDSDEVAGDGPSSGSTKKQVSNQELVDKVAAESSELAYTEPPPALYDTSELDLSTWSIIVTDNSMRQIAETSERRSKADNQVQRLTDSQGNLLSAVTVSSAASGRPTSGLRKLLLPKASSVTDMGFQQLARCPALQELDASNVRRVTDAGLRAVAMACTQLVQLDLSHMVRATGTGLASVGECCPHIRKLTLAHCPNIQEWVLLRLFNGCAVLEELDLSYCTTVGDSALKAIGANCSSLQRLQLRNCRQVSDAGLLPVCQACPGMYYLDLAVEDLPFRLSDVGLLAIGENCPEMKHLDLFGREKLTDVGLSWLAEGCHTLTHLDLGKCVKVTDAGLRQLSEGCRELTSLSVQDMKLVTDVGVRHLSDGCKNLVKLNLGGIWLISDGVERDFALEGLQALSIGCEYITELSLTNCFRVANKTLRALGKGPGKNFTKLGLRGCNGMNAEAFHALAHVCHGLLEVDISSCEQACDKMCHTLGRHCRQLHTVSLAEDVLVTDRGVMHLAHGCKRLTSLNLTNCAGVGDPSLMALCDARLVPGLSVLELSGCAEVTDTGVSWLSDRCTALTTLSLQGTKCGRPGLKAMQGGWKYGQYTSQGQWFGIMPRPRAHDMRRIDDYAQEWRSATMVQACWRGVLGRAQFAIARERHTMHWVCMRLQSLQRGATARAATRARRAERMRQMRAAVIIQRVARAKVSRVLVRRRREELALERRHRAATLIQTRWRGVEARLHYADRRLRHRKFMLACHMGASLVQALWRGRVGREQFMLARASKIAREREQNAAATHIQAVYRGLEGRRELARRKRRAKIRAQQEQRAALMMQSVVRGRFGRRCAAQRRLDIAQRKAASVRIQARFRARRGFVRAQRKRRGIVEAREFAAALQIQAAWRARMGRFEAYRLQVKRDEEAEEMVYAARLVQRAFRGYLGRKDYLKQKRYKEGLVREQRQIEGWATTLIQATFRGYHGRQQYKGVVDEKKRRWKEMTDGDGLPFFYNVITGEMRRRRPQDLLDLLPRPTCNNCKLPVPATRECKGCSEFYCEACFAKVHSGGNRKHHEYRVLFDFYNRRVDYGEGDFPSLWPSEIEQDEMSGWKLRVNPVRKPTHKSADGGDWERYRDPKSGRDFYQNTRTKETTYSRPAGFTTPRKAAPVQKPPEWLRRTDAESGKMYYYNSATLETSYVRPPGFE